MRVLFIVPYVPNLIRVRPYNLIRHLAARGHEVTLLTLWSDQEEQADAEALKAHCHRVIALPLARYRSLWNCLCALPNSMPLQAAYCWSPHVESQIAHLNPRTFDLVHVEHLRGARYGLAIRNLYSASYDAQPPVIWDSVDCISYLFEQASHNSRSAFGRLVTRFELGRTERYEGWLVEQFDKVLVTSQTDRQALQALHASHIGHQAPRITVLPNGVDLTYFTPTDEPREADTLIFSGKMSYHANVTAVLHLVNEIMPHVWAERRHVRLIIAGKDPPRGVRALATRHWPLVRVTGTVPDIRPYLRQATAAVVPTPYGAGIQNKVLEAMACETPVVASTQAVTALQVTDGQEVLVARGPVEFAQQVLALLEDEALRKRIGREGRQYVERHHDWSAIAEQLERTYQDAIREHGSRSRTGRPSN